MARMTPFLAFALSVVLSLHAVIASRIADSGNYRIVSLTGDFNTKLGISPGFPRDQPLSINGKVDTFKVDKVEGDEFHIAIGGYPSVGNKGNEVFASISPVQPATWLLRYSERLDAYTIEIPNESRGWVLHPDSGDAPVSIGPILIVPTFPPTFLPNELWRFEPVE